MHCAEFKNRLDALSDARMPLDSDMALAAHARRCSDCADWMNAHARLSATVRRSPRPAPQPDFALHVMHLVADPQPQVRSRFLAARRRSHLRVPNPAPTINYWQRSRRLSIAALAAAAAALLIAALSWHGRQAVNPAAHPEIVQHQPVAFAEHYQRLAQQTGNFANTLSDRQRVVVGGLTEGFKPVTRSVYTALNSLWRTMPGSELAQAML